MSTTFAVGDQVIVRSDSRRYVLDRIERETATRWVCESGKWFDKSSGYGPRSGNYMGLRDELLRADDPVALRTLRQDQLRNAAYFVDKLSKEQRIDLPRLRQATERLTAAVEQYALAVEQQSLTN